MKKLSEASVVNLARKFSNRSKSYFDEFIKVSIGDDCFDFVTPKGFEVCVTVDALIEKIHFDLNWINLKELGYKSCAVSLSDLASMGAIPAYFLLTLGLKKDFGEREVKDFLNGFMKCAEDYGGKITGGDTVRSELLTVAVTAIGFVEEGKALRRSKAIPGMNIFVTGNLGSSAAGLFLLQNVGDINVSKRDFKKLRKAHIKPVPQIELGRSLVKAGIRVCEDISDGLAKEIRNICAESECGAEIYEKEIPIDKNLLKLSKVSSFDVMKAVLSGGEDYELVYAAEKEEQKRLEKIFKESGIDVQTTIVGRITERSKGIKLILKSGEITNLPGGFDHFSN